MTQINYVPGSRDVNVSTDNLLNYLQTSDIVGFQVPDVEEILYSDFDPSTVTLVELIKIINAIIKSLQSVGAIGEL